MDREEPVDLSEWTLKSYFMYFLFFLGLMYLSSFPRRNCVHNVRPTPSHNPNVVAISHDTGHSDDLLRKILQRCKHDNQHRLDYTVKSRYVARNRIISLQHQLTTLEIKYNKIREEFMHLSKEMDTIKNITRLG